MYQESDIQAGGGWDLRLLLEKRALPSLYLRAITPKVMVSRLQILPIRSPTSDQPYLGGR